MILKVILLIAYAGFCEAQQVEGETCYAKGVKGVCIKLGQCRTAVGDRKQHGTHPQFCSFDDSLPVVCCTDKQAVSPPPPPPASDADDGCEPLDPSVSPPKKTGQKAFDKCIEYQKKYVYPCEPGVSLLGEPTRSNRCYHETDELIIAGTDAAQYEFPHMVLLGFQSSNGIKYQCGGSIISEQFVLTAGHCTGHRDFGPVKYIAIGALQRSDVDVQSNVYKVKKIIAHPQYKPPVLYNDIALLETDKPMALNQFIVPACLHIGDPVDESRVLATGWGFTHYGRMDLSDILQKVILDKFSAGECTQKYSNVRLMKRGFEDSTQTCYGDKAAELVEDKSESKDTCQGDSGGPIQINSKNIHCMYTVVGVTSVGKYCGFADTPGLYTRVAPYVPWIESIVWPN